MYYFSYFCRSKSSTSGRTSHGRGDSSRVGASATYASRTQASGRNQPSGTSTQNQPQPSRTSTRGRGHHTNTQSPTNNNSPTSRQHQSSYAGNRHHQPREIPTTLRTTSTSMPSGVLSTASAEVCVDDTSLAENCFDYFTLAIIWSPGYAFKQSRQGQSPRKNTPIQWSIHGLWPSMYSRTASIPSRCNRTDVFFSLHQMNNIRGLREKLDNTWYSILSPGFTNTKLWEHEFIKHGNCCTRSRAIRNCGGYFTKTYELFKNMDIATTLSNARYRPGTVDSLRTVIKIIEKKHKKKVKVDFVTNTVSYAMFLYHNFSFIETVY